MKLKHLSGSIFIALSSMSMAVPTTTTDLGVLDANGSQFEKAWLRFFGQGSTLGDFVDTYTFSLSAASDAIGAIFQFDFGSLSLLLNSVSLYKIGDSGPIQVDYSPSLFTFNGLDAGNYKFDLAGTVTSNGSFFDSGGAYYRGAIRSYTTIASPAPEPATIAMVLAGLAAIGTMIATRRRRH